MVRPLIALVLCTLAAGANRDGDYVGGLMPHYSMEDGNRELVPQSDEYLDRSPDAPAPLDYKYEEELADKVDKSPMKIDEESWHNPKQKLKEFLTDDEDVEQQDSAPKRKISRKNRKHRTRIKNQDVFRESSRRVTKFSRSRKIANDDIDIRNDYYVNKGRTREDNSIDSNNFHFRETTQKVIRRKPRDRSISRRRSDEDEDDEEERKQFEKENDNEDAVIQNDERRRFIAERQRIKPEVSKIKHKNYPEYEDYYDMKRVQNIKDKLPGLLRKTQASAAETPSTRHLQDITIRHVNLHEKTTESTITKTKATTINITRTSEVRTDIIPISTINATDLSLAEKSRLSILKKSQRKDDVRNVTWTTKPPVLMQVTRGMQTLVMVERPQQSNIRLRAREIFDDSPERIASAKKLMRRKLVAGARSIHDLTDNWDEMVCDYIDVSLLDNGSPSLNYPIPFIFISVISSCYTKMVV